MQAQKVPSEGPERVFWDLAVLFAMYRSYTDFVFPFWWLRKTKELEVLCSDATADKVTFSTPPALLDAIHQCRQVTEPKQFDLDDWNFSGFIREIIYEIQSEVPSIKLQDFKGPFLQWLYRIYLESNANIKGIKIVHIHPQHWSCIIREDSVAIDREQQNNRRDYFLRTEVLAVTAIFCRQMNAIEWNAETNKYDAELVYRRGPLTATVLSFTGGKVRVVQGTCDPSQNKPTLNLTLRAIYKLGENCYNPKDAIEVLQWILSPPDGTKLLAIRKKR